MGWNKIYTDGLIVNAVERAISLQPKRILLDIDGTLFMQGTSDPIDATLAIAVKRLNDWRKETGGEYGFLAGRTRGQENTTREALENVGLSSELYEGKAEGRKQVSELIIDRTILLDDNIVGNIGPFVMTNTPGKKVAGIKVGFGPEVMSPFEFEGLPQEMMAPGSRFTMSDGTDYVSQLRSTPVAKLPPKQSLAPVASPPPKRKGYDFDSMSAAQMNDYVELSEALEAKKKYIKVTSLSATTLQEYVQIVETADDTVTEVKSEGENLALYAGDVRKYLLSTMPPAKNRSSTIVIDVKLAKPPAILSRSRFTGGGGASPGAAADRLTGASPVAATNEQCSGCADLERRLKELERRLAMSEAYELAQARLIEYQFVQLGVPFTTVRGKKVILGSLNDIVGTPQQPEGPNGFGAYVRASTVRKLEEEN